tara:strand:- start:2009 stop:3361 length:1353 start_codon:yes stop_codon:yes gene_type:complete
MNQKLIEIFNKYKRKLKDRTFVSLKQGKLKIKKEFNSLKLLKNQNTAKFLEIGRDKLNKIQDKFEKSFKKISFDESLLKQSEFWLKSVTWTLIGTSSFALLWLCLAKTEEVVVTTGKLDPKGDVKEIQIPLGGVIDEILVESGDNVESGQILVQLDKEASFEKFKSIEIAVFEKQFQLEKISSILKLKQTQVKQESLIFNERIENVSKKIEINTPLQNSFETIYKEGGISRVQFYEEKIKFNELKSELSRLLIEKDKVTNLINQDIEQLESELAKIRTEISGLNSELISAKVTLRYQSLESPVTGIVFDLKPTTEGYVAQSSEPIMKIVPFDDLEADIEIPSNKIGFVKVGMPVDISIDSFPSTDFGVLKGTIKSIGSDALVPSQIEQRPEYRFPAVVQLDNQKLKLKNGKSLPLQVGMSLSANIKLRKVSYIKLLLRGLSNRVDSIQAI